MIIKILGIFDIITAVLFWIFYFFDIIPKSLVLISAFYLLAKGVFFLISSDIASIIDVVCSITIFLSLAILIPKFIAILVVLFLLQKGIFSLIS